MNHLDEGTIHAWLDGALDAAQAREVEAHIATCRACSAAVAEARGLIAGASRILTALDDVPGGVIPKAAPPRPHATRVTRSGWRPARWVTGIAAALLLAIGVTTWNRGAVKEQAASVDMLRGASDSRAEPTAATAQAERPQEPSPGVVGGAVGAVLATPPAATARQTQPPPAERFSEAGKGAVAAAAPEVAQVKKAAPSQLNDVAVTVAPSNQARSDALPRVASGSAAAGAAAPAPAPLAIRPSERADLSELTGCYALGARDPESVVATAAPEAASEEARARRRTASAPAAPRAAAPTREIASAADAAATTLLVVRLDSLRTDSAYVARAQNQAVVGSWSPAGADSVRIRAYGRALTLPRTARRPCP